MTNPFTPAVHRYQVSGEDQPAQQAQEVTAGPQKMSASGSFVGGITSVVVNSAGTSVTSGSDLHRHVTASLGEPRGSSAPANGVHYTTPYGTPLAASDAKSTDLVHINGQTCTVQVAKAAGLL
jgi:hypothetical protein